MTLRIKQPQIRPDWPWEEVATTDDNESVLENKMVNTVDVTGVGVCGGWCPYLNLQVGSKRA